MVWRREQTHGCSETESWEQVCQWWRSRDRSQIQGLSDKWSGAERFGLGMSLSGWFASKWVCDHREGGGTPRWGRRSTHWAGCCWRTSKERPGHQPSELMTRQPFVARARAVPVQGWRWKAVRIVWTERKGNKEDMKPCAVMHMWPYREGWGGFFKNPDRPEFVKW